MGFSTIPFLFLLLLAFWLWRTRSAHCRKKLSNEQAVSILVWLVILILWGVTTSTLSICGVYASSAFLALLPGFWIPLIPMLLSAGLYTTWPVFRVAVQSVVTETPRQSFITIQALRIAAIGGLYKATQGLMPATFTFWVGIPDFLYGASALILAIPGVYQQMNSRLLGLWNIAGIGIIFATAPFIFQMSLPGPLYFFQNLPDGRALLEFPMVLAPTLVVPFFLIINAIVADHLLRTHQ